MPRMVAPPPSGEFNIRLVKPFSGPPSHIVEITGQPNRAGTVKTIDHTGSHIVEKIGDLSKDEVNDLLEEVERVRGFPSHPTEDIYGANERLELQTFEIQWCNEDVDPAADAIHEITADTKKTFRKVCSHVYAAGRHAKRSI